MSVKSEVDLERKGVSFRSNYVINIPITITRTNKRRDIALCSDDFRVVDWARAYVVQLKEARTALEVFGLGYR